MTVWKCKNSQQMKNKNETAQKQAPKWKRWTVSN